MNKDIAVLIKFVLAVAASELARDAIGNLYGATATSITAKNVIDFNAKVNQQNQQKSQKSLRQLVVVPSTADGFPDDLDGYVEPDPYKNDPVAFVSSKVPARRIPYLNIFIHEHHITPHMQKVSLMSKFNTLLCQDLDEIEKYLDIDI